MKVIKHGIYGNAGAYVTCICGCEFLIEDKSDIKGIKGRLEINGAPYVELLTKCPECAETLQLGKWSGYKKTDGYSYDPEISTTCFQSEDFEQRFGILYEEAEEK